MLTLATCVSQRYANFIAKSMHPLCIFIFSFFGASIQRKNSKKIKHVLFYSKRITLISSKEQCILKRAEKETFHSLGRNSSS